jgi:hypothetical protein
LQQGHEYWHSEAYLSTLFADVMHFFGYPRNTVTYCFSAIFILFYPELILY